MSDEELELHIADCGRHFLKAHALGDMAEARRWLDLQAEAVKSRSPAQVARMEACYFAAQGDQARQAAERRAIG